ncbi:ChbG/HpnK family deacetylase [Microvirga mediterraneensis]|uniref:ChbG/HpnK family deacetylase n=1 Tax=Microvirga mediterraneensis TaxID=2754695 RepID=A0A838BUG0_9HYPH|nr:ChbG/HpnK family deacetylase [Microvirga mediterraneensis]MBA1158096.1 ChbG/HpnK family deacetylase [Microvirga mediterraneensis]
MNSSRSVILCADDFGLADGVSRGIVELAGMGRLSATGAMTNMPGWRRAAASLTPVRDRMAVGLHLNLTTGSPLGPMSALAPSGRFPTLKELLPKALKRRWPAAEIAAEIGRQIDAFEEVFGAAPAFVDGHQHVHVLPVIRPALIAALKARGYAGRVWLRDPSDRAMAILRRPIGRNKALIVKSLARGFARQAHAEGFRTNKGFSGFAPLDLSVPAAKVFEEAFSSLGAHPLVMCHPGYVDDELRSLDPAVESRVEELDYLKSDAFGELLAQRGLRLVSRFKAT